jgi:glycosyltransferase involved in cell wall biosynthesis
LKRSPFPIEVIVVDNNSSDKTAELALEWAERRNVSYLRVISEKQQGLSFARRAGVSAAQYEVIIFCDDDKILCEEYATRACSLFMSNPRIGVIGGLGKELLEGQRPVWWPMFSKSYAVGPQGDESGPVKATRGYVYGAGMCVRKSLMMSLIGYNFEPLLKDRDGQELSSGGDVEICFLIQAMGYEIWYDEHLKFDHVIDQRRLTWEYYLKLKQGISRSFPAGFSFRLFRRRHDVSVIDFITHYLRMLRSMLRRYFSKDENQYSAEVNKLVAGSALRYLILHPILMIKTFGRIRQIVRVLRLRR